jgi:3-isopropylmalate dehydrogenase
MAAIMAGQMLLENLPEDRAAQAVEKAVVKVVSEKLRGMAAGKMGYSTTQVGDLVAGLV